jgi:glycolate dehydrogenase FAD-binding subunit
MVIEHQAGDLTCTVEAGTPLAELQAALARGRQMLALDPPDDGTLTVGEVFDRALFGPRAHRYGLPRDLILGVRIRLRDGTVVSGGGKVVKNVAGYDLPKLVTGAHGLVGELLELTLRLHPLPRATATVVAPLVDPLPLERLMPACVDTDGERLLVRFESPAAEALAGSARGLLGPEARLVADDEGLWAAHRERQHGLHLHRCPPAGAMTALDALRSRGATRLTGRWARGWLFADVESERPNPTVLERRVLERLGG